MSSTPAWDPAQHPRSTDGNGQFAPAPANPEAGELDLAGAEEWRAPGLAGVLAGGGYEQSWPEFDPPDGCEWVAVQRDDELEIHEGDEDAANSYAAYVRSPIAPVRGITSYEDDPWDMFVAVPTDRTPPPLPPVDGWPESWVNAFSLDMARRSAGWAEVAGELPAGAPEE